MLGGGGGGRDDVAQGGGTDASALPAALGAVDGGAGAPRERVPSRRAARHRRRARPASASRAATRTGCWRRRSRPCRAPTASVARIVELAAEHDAVEIVVGLPLNMRGGDTASTDGRARVRGGAGRGIRPARPTGRRAAAARCPHTRHCAIRADPSVHLVALLTRSPPSCCCSRHSTSRRAPDGPAGSPVPPAQEPA